MADFTQDSHLISITTPLGKDELYLRSFDGTEEFSRLFCYSLELYSDKDWIDPKQIVGKNVTVKIRYPDDSDRYFNGIISRFTYTGTGDRFSGYRAEMVPAAWMLTRTADCRIFQEMDIPAIIEQIFNDCGFTDYKLSLNKTYPTREYCVQYRETDFNFVSRLMEQYGIFYYFQHSDGKHEMVLADDKSAYEDVKENDQRLERNVANTESTLTGWEHQFEFRPGKWAHTDYNFETPTKPLMTKADTIVDLPNNKSYEIYDYPGIHTDEDEGKTHVQVRMEEEEVPHDVVIGTSACRSFTPGGKFKISKHISSAEVGKSYVITSVTHSASVGSYTTGVFDGDVTYTNRFTCVPDSVVIRPQRLTPKPTIQGSQTAVVVGPPGEEIWPDKYGRVKVQFHWDREGEKDDKSSCWIRCQQPSAGRNWGTMSIPRVGQEVVVSYLEGDPDRPLVTGVVYNADQMPAYELPNEKTKSYTKTNSSTGGEGHNEVRFEDKAGEEQVYMHAEKDMDVRVKNDSRERIVGNRHQIVGTDENGKSGDQIELVWQDQHLTVKRDQIEHIEGSRQLMVGNGDAAGGGNLDVVVAGQEARKVGMGGHHLDVEGDRRAKVGMNCSTDVSMNCDHKVGMNYGLEATNVHLKGGMNVVVEAGLSLTLKVGGNFVNISPAGVSIVGTMVLINSGGASGAGMGCSPQAPTAAQEASPEEPDEADDSESGRKSCD